MAELKKEKKGFIDWSKIDINSPILWNTEKPVGGYISRDPFAGDKLIQKIKLKEAELKKAKEQAEKEKTKLGFGDPIKDNKWLVYGLIAVAGYFAYKKFKK